MHMRIALVVVVLVVSLVLVVLFIRSVRCTAMSACAGGSGAGIAWPALSCFRVVLWGVWVLVWLLRLRCRVVLCTWYVVTVVLEVS